MKNKVIPLLLLFFLLFSFSGCVVISIEDFPSYENEKKYSAASGSTAADDVVSIDIGWVSGSINIARSSDVDKITFYEESSMSKSSDSLGSLSDDKELLESLKMRYLIEDGVLKIRYCRSGLRVRYGAVKELKKDLTVLVPDNVNIDNIKADFVSSDVCLTELECNTIELHSVSASIKLIDCDAGGIRCDTVSGKIYVDSKTELKKLDAKTVSGDVTVKAPSVVELNASSVSSSILLELDKADFTLTFNGVVKTLSTVGFEYTETDGGTKVFGDGTGTVSIESVSGKITVKER